MRRTFQIGVWAVGMLLGSRAGVAQPADANKADEGRGGPAACQSAYKKAQKAEQDGELVTAKRFLRSCARAKCGTFLEHECTVSFARIGSEMPSVVPIATDEAGKPVIDVTLRVDGYVLASKLDGHAVPINPGMHEFLFETKSGDVISKRRIMILQGQRNRRLAVSVSKSQIQAGAAKRTEPEPAASAISEEEPKPRPSQSPRGRSPGTRRRRRLPRQSRRTSLNRRRGPTSYRARRRPRRARRTAGCPPDRTCSSARAWPASPAMGC